MRKLRSLEILDTAPEPIFDELTELAAYICDTPVSMVSLIDKERQWFKSRFNWDTEFTERSIAFCRYTILSDDIFEVEDASGHELTNGNPLVQGEPGIRFYAGAPLLSSDGFALGTICVIDFAPKKLNDKQRQALRTLSRQVAALIEARRIGKEFGVDYSTQSQQQYERTNYHKLAAQELGRLLSTVDSDNPSIRKAKGIARDLEAYNAINKEGMEKKEEAFDLQELLRAEIEKHNASSDAPAPVILFLDEHIPLPVVGDASHLKQLTQLLFDTLLYSGSDQVRFSAEVQWEDGNSVKILFTLHEPASGWEHKALEVEQKLKQELINKILARYKDSLHISFESDIKLQSFEMGFEKA